MNIIYKLHYFRMCVVLATLFIILNCDPPPDYSLTVAPSSYMIQDVTNYVFTISIIGDGVTTATVFPGSSLIIYFPTQFTGSSNQSYTCSIISWPIATSSLTCSMNYNTMTIQGAFPSALNIAVDSNYNLQFVINSIQNPNNAQTTSQFTGEVDFNGSTIFTTSSAGITILSGSLSVSLSVSPTTADALSTLTVVCKPTHSIPMGGILKFTVDYYWSTSVYHTRGTISQSPLCVGINNTLSNLYCTYTFTSTTFTVSVLNIFNVASNSSFSFTLFPFSNPPSAQPIGSITFQTFSNSLNTGLVIDSSANNQITGITPSPIQNPQLTLSSYSLGANTQAVFSLLITNSIAINDVFYISNPPQINVSNVQQITMAGTSTSYISILSSNLFSFTKISLSSPYTINITIQNITLPNYVASITSPFSIYVLRNSFLVCSTTVSFNISLNPGSMNATLASSNQQAGVIADYSFFLSFQNDIQSSSRISFYFNAQYFSIGGNISCISSGSSNCSVVQASNNTIIVGSVTLATVSTLSIVISGITNPSTIGNFTAIMITSYFLFNGSYYVQDINQNSAFFSLSPRPLTLSNINISSTSYQVYALSDYTFSLRNNNQIAANSYIWIIFPSDIKFSAITCNLVCISGTYNNSQGVQFQQIGPLSASTLSALTVYHVINPISTKPTSSFQIYIFNAQNQLLQYLYNAPSFVATSPSVLSVSVSANSVRNSGVGWFNISLSPSYAITQAVSIVLVAPNSLNCPTCPTQIINSSYNQMIYYNQVMNSSFQLNLPNFTNYFSYQPISLQAAIMSNDLIYDYANGSLIRANQQPSTPSFIYSFTNYELSTSTDLLIANLTSGTVSSNIFSIIITFGADFTLTSSNCTSNGYSCVILNNQVTFVVSNPGTLAMLTIKNIITPSLSPSTAISLSTYSSNGYLIDQNSIMIWAIICQLPCKTCQPANISSCLSCYSDLSLVTNQIYYFNSNHTCVSDCGNLYYKNYSTNSCQLCSSQCYNCYNYSFCTSCPSSQYLLLTNSTCYSVCPHGYFLQATQCIACTAALNCYTCSNQLTCSSCVGKFYYQLQCLTSCPTGVTTPNTTIWICSACPTNCSNCLLDNSSSVICTSCSYGLLDSGKCVSSCQSPGTVPNGLVCSSCNSNCLTCQGSTTFCLSCNTSSSYPYFLSNRCYTTCPNTYYNDNNSYACLSCTKPCEICSTFSSTSCISCISSYSLYNTICQSACPSQFYSNSSQCVSCVAPCLTCGSINICFTCQNNYTLVSSNNTCVLTCPLGYISINQTCVKCSSNCLTCLTLSFCLTCPNTTYILNGSCLYPCPSAYYPNAISQSCSSCPYSCALCQNSSFCTSCLAGYEVQLNYSCMSLCPSTQIPISGICINCSSNCSSCQNTINNCTSCSSGYVYVQTLFSCYSSCPPSYYYYPLNQTCLGSCPSAYYTVTNSTTLISTCTSCPQYCTSCISELYCGGCELGTYLYLSLCYSSCPFSAPYPFNNICQTCNVVDCFQCSGINCASCISGKLLIGTSLCLSSCSTSQVYNSINKTCDTIENNSNSTINVTTNGSSLSASSSSLTSSLSLNFIPMPFLIIYSITVIIIILLSCQKKLASVPTLFGVIGPVFTLACLILIIVSFSLQQITTALSESGIYMIISGLILLAFTNIITVYLRWKITQWQKWVILLLGFLHFSSIALLTANIDSYNSYFIQDHKPFWKKYKFICKISNFVHLIIFIGSVLLIFAIKDHANYVFYAGIQLSILTSLTCILAWAWILVPLEQPIEQIVSEQSSQNMDHLSQKMNHLTPPTPEESSEQKIRKSNIKSEGDSSSHLDQDIAGKTKSNYEFNRIVGVVQVNKDEIAEALEKGLFRKNKEQILKQIEEIQELSKIDSAAKLNNYIQTQKKGQQKNIFDNDDADQIIKDQPQDEKLATDNKKADLIIQNQEVQQNQKEALSKKSSQFALFNEIIFSKEEDFQHNIIFEEDEQNLTFYEDQDSEAKSVSPNIFEMNHISSIGQILPQDTTKIKLENKESNEKDHNDLITPLSSEKLNETGNVLILDVQDNQSQLQKIQVFHNPAQSRIKPINKFKELKEIIHADFEEIITISDENSLQFFEDEGYEHRGSSRKINASKPNEIIQDLDADLPPPSEILRLASVYYQPKVEKNQPPKEKKEESTLRGLRRRK